MAARRAPTVKAALAALGADAALTAPAPPLVLWPPPGRKTGWGCGRAAPVALPVVAAWLPATAAAVPPRT